MSAPTNPPDPRCAGGFAQASLDTALKSLWGASQLPFGAAVEKPYASESFQQTHHRLEQLVAVRAGGLLHGPNGVGKTLLVQHFLGSLPDKRYKPVVLSHSSVTGTDLLRLLCTELGQTARMRRGDNVLLIHTWTEQASRISARAAGAGSAAGISRSLGRVVPLGGRVTGVLAGRGEMDSIAPTEARRLNTWRANCSEALRTLALSQARTSSWVPVIANRNVLGFTNANTTRSPLEIRNSNSLGVSRRRPKAA